MNFIHYCCLLLVAGLLAACAPGSRPPLHVYALAQRDAAGNAYIVSEERFWGADANFVLLKFWRAAAGEHAPLLRLTLDDWCGNPIVWQLAEDGIVVPAAPATPRTDPENPDKCTAQPARAFVLRGNQVVVEQR